MGYNISEVTGSTGGPDEWSFTADLTTPGITTISGDFDVVSLNDGDNLGEATGGYTFSALSTTAYGTLSFDTVTGEFTFTIDRAALIASGSNQVVTFTVTGTSGGNSDTDTVTLNLLICVLRGTMIETADGPRPVEDIRKGDLVLTRDNGWQPVQWIGARRVGTDELATVPSLRPVRIQAGALGDGLPRRDLGVSPQHRVLITHWRAELMFGEHEVLVPAKALVDDDRIRVDDSGAPVEYFHLLFDAHEVMFTEGAPTESFHPGALAIRELGDAARVELQRLFPDLFENATRSRSARAALQPWEGAVCLAEPKALQPC